MSLCGARALAWGRLESALPFKLRARPPSSAAQVFVLWLVFTKSCWKHSLPFLKEWEADILLCLKVSTWAKTSEVCGSRWCCVCRCGAAAPKALQSCTAPAPGSAWPQHLDWRGLCLGLQNLGECDVPLDHQDGLCEGQQKQKCLWEVHLSTAWVNEPWLDLSPGEKCLVLLFERIQLGLPALELGNRKTYKTNFQRIACHILSRFWDFNQFICIFLTIKSLYQWV